MKIIGIVQARMGSTRLPQKVMKTINGVPLIELLLSRLSNSKELSDIVVATPSSIDNLPLHNHIRNLGFSCEEGSEDDVLDRFFQVATKYRADAVVRITGDCPLVDPQLVDSLIRHFKQLNVDYVSNISPPTYPDGLDIEVFTYHSLQIAATNATDMFDREHVTPYLRQSGLFETASFKNEEDLSELRWTVDDFNDFDVIENIFNYFHPKTNFCWTEILELEKKQPELFNSNKHNIRNKGAEMGTGQKLWQRAKRVIPGGNMLLSKRSEMFLPDQWPAYFSKSKGCKVWDLDGREYIDMSIMGIGTNVLGYGHPEVDAAVRATIDNGNMSTLNCPEEVYLAEKLVEIHPWADMVRLARSGGEANSIAIRIARAATGKDKIAICGYHGWHDWYLSANLNNDTNLDGHLLPGLSPAGVPRNLNNTVFPFTYNNLSELENLIQTQDIGVIKMEVQRNQEPENDFLLHVRNLSKRKNIILIFDECTSGFRQNFGGLHSTYGVSPDIAIFGKTLGNGYAISAVIGRRDIMEFAQNTFISSTFWTERIGPTAALKTLEVMEKTKSWEMITNTGLRIREGWKNLAKKYHLGLDYWGLPSLSGYTFQSKNSLAYKTLITQEMLRQNYLASNCVYTCIEHKDHILDEYFDKLDPIFSLIKECEDGRDIMSLLQGPICHSGFSRLN